MICKKYTAKQIVEKAFNDGFIITTSEFLGALRNGTFSKRGAYRQQHTRVLFFDDEFYAKNVIPYCKIRDEELCKTKTPYRDRIIAKNKIVCSLRKEGLSINEIGKRMSMSKQNVHTIIKHST